MYLIPCIGGPIDGEELLHGIVPKDGEVDICGHHCYEFNYEQWQWEYHVVNEVEHNGHVIRFGSHKHLCRVTGRMVVQGLLTWPDAANITCRNRALLFQKDRILELMYREGAL